MKKQLDITPRQASLESGDTPTPPPAPFIPFANKQQQAAPDAAPPAAPAPFVPFSKTVGGNGGGNPEPSAPGTPFMPFAKQQSPSSGEMNSNAAAPPAPFVPFAKQNAGGDGGPTPPPAPFIPFSKQNPGVAGRPADIDMSAQAAPHITPIASRDMAPLPQLQVTQKPSSSAPAIIAGIMCLLLVAAVGVGFVMLKSKTQPKMGSNDVVAPSDTIQPASVVISSKPSGAKVFMNGKQVGMTPLTLKSVKPDIYEIEVRKQGYMTTKEHLGINAGDKVTKSYGLERPAKIAFHGVPDGADVIIDGNKVKLQGGSYQVGAGKHRIIIRADGCRDDDESVTAKAGGTVDVSAHLQSLGGPAQPTSAAPEENHTIVVAPPAGGGPGITGGNPYGTMSNPPPPSNPGNTTPPPPPPPPVRQMPSGVVVNGNPQATSTPAPTNTSGIPGL